MSNMHQEFEFEGRKLEVRAESTPNHAGWTVRVFEDGRPATAIAYTVTYLTMIDTQMALNIDVVNELMKSAQRSVEQKWDTLVAD
jgi:hypothetical protein